MALVELAKFDNSLEAGLVHGRLAAEGITSFMFDLGTAEALGFVVPIRLMVDDKDLDEARAVLADQGK